MLSLFAAVVAVALFPGGVFTLAAAGGTAVAARLTPARAPWSSASLGAAVLLLFAAALVPLPASPSSALPLDSGTQADLLGALILLGAGLAVGGPPSWPRARLVAAVAALAPLLVLAAGAATLDLPVVVALPGRQLAAARALAAAAILFAAPVAARSADAGIPRGLRALQLAVPALFAAVLLAPPGWSGLPAAVCAAMVVGGVAVYAALAGTLCRLGPAADRVLSAIATVAAIASIVLTALGSH